MSDTGVGERAKSSANTVRRRRQGYLKHLVDLIAAGTGVDSTRDSTDSVADPLVPRPG